jgi:hypothetical protein
VDLKIPMTPAIPPFDFDIHDSLLDIRFSPVPNGHGRSRYKVKCNSRLPIGERSLTYGATAGRFRGIVANRFVERPHHHGEQEMKIAFGVMPLLAVLLAVTLSAQAQESAEQEGVKEQAEELVSGTRDKVERIAEDVDKSEQAQEASAGILKHIYMLAEHLSFPAFHWIAFAIMVTGVVSFALQLVLAKLIVLSKLGFSLTEILSDALGLVISLTGLVLTTQAATENSNFTQSPAGVLSATAVGVIVGFIFYLWGQSQEVRAVEGGRQKKS